MTVEEVNESVSTEALSGPERWSIHVSDDGRTFYFDKTNQTSVWEKPDDLKTDAEKELDACVWSEYKTEDNEVYYYNKETKETTWTIPDDLKHLKDLIQNAEQKKNSSANKKPQNNENRYSEKYETLEDARAAFKALLTDFNIPSSSTYDSAVKLVIEDPRFTALKHNNERKQVFNTYKQNKANEERDQERKIARENEDKLMDFLIKSQSLFPSMRFSKASQIFQSEVLWLRVPERDRREIFNDALKKRERIEKENERERHGQNREYIRNILESKINHKLKPITPWDSLVKVLENFSKDTNDVLVAKLLKNDPIDIMVEYESYMRSLISKKEKELNEIKKNEYRAARKNRQAFWGILKSLHKEGKIEKETKWKDIYPLLADDEVLNNMYSQKGSNVVDLFKIFIYKLVLKEHAERKKYILKLPENVEFYDYLKSIRSKISSKTKYEDVCGDFNIIQEHGEFIFKRFKSKLKRKESNKKASKRGHSDRRNNESDFHHEEDSHRSKKKKTREHS